MLKNPFYQKSLLKLIDYRKIDIDLLLTIARYLKMQKRSGNETRRLGGKNIALIFEKPSTRTRIAFEVAAYDQGANVTFLDTQVSQLGNKESFKDSARVLGRIYDAIQYRGASQRSVESLAKYSGVPVYNGLSDEFHPTQGLADLLTMMENSHKNLSDIRFCFVGDCRFNMANTLLLGGTLMGMDVRLLCPQPLSPDIAIIKKANELAKISGGQITITDEQHQALSGCDFIHTDVWVSMGEDESVWLERIKLLKPYQVNQAMMQKTGRPDTKFMHCLPAFHNRDTSIGEAIFQRYGLAALEVDEAVFESPVSIVFEQAENRLHTIKALLTATLIDDLSFIEGFAQRQTL